jgi:hypothetical protein
VNPEAAPVRIAEDSSASSAKKPDRPMRPFLVSSTRSPLANPKTPAHRLAAQLQSLLYFPDPSPLYAVLGALAANTMRGYPVWLMLVGPPESGKTELLRPVANLPGCRECGDLTGKAALLSGTPARDAASDSTGGLLKSMIDAGDGKSHRGALVMLDFARTVLAADPATSRSTLGAIGMLHDQHYQREIGTDGGRTISFHGRIGFLAATTDVIDHPDHQRANAEMGERCLYYRYPESDGRHEINAALDNPDGTSKTERLQDLFLEFWFDADLDWNAKPEPRPLTDDERRRIAALAQFCARGRSGVQRDRYMKHEISGVTRPALGPRIANTLAQLMRGMEHVGCTTADIARVLRQCAMDSLPGTRALALRFIRDGIYGVSDLADLVKISQGAMKRTLEDLRAHGLLASDQAGARWELSEHALALLKTGWGEVDQV